MTSRYSRYSRESSTHPQFLSYFKAQGVRRMNATQPKEEEIYIDTRNLWKASTVSQEKQYESIRNSGILNSNRKLTFIKFNYRSSQDRNVSYGDVFQVLKKKKREQIDSIKKYKQNKLKQNINLINLQLNNQIKCKQFNVQKNWLEQYHQSDKYNQINYNKKQHFGLGTMNVNDLWGDKQLQECLGYLPCKRDRSKMLKLYSKNLRKIKCKTDLIDKKQFSNYY